MRHLRPFVCERCRTIVRDLEDQRVLSLDSTDPSTTRRYRRVQLGRTCATCAQDIYLEAERRDLFMT